MSAAVLVLCTRYLMFAVTCVLQPYDLEFVKQSGNDVLP